MNVDTFWRWVHIWLIFTYRKSIWLDWGYLHPDGTCVCFCWSRGTLLQSLNHHWSNPRILGLVFSTNQNPYQRLPSGQPHSSHVLKAHASGFSSQVVFVWLTLRWFPLLLVKNRNYVFSRIQLFYTKRFFKSICFSILFEKVLLVILWLKKRFDYIPLIHL